MRTDSREREDARLEALAAQRILDTHPERGFDDLTCLAAVVCQTPIAIISFIDQHRQWFKSKVGVDVSEVPREIGFCTRAIQGNDLLVVTDTLEDPRFALAMPVLSGCQVRFYAGMPLLTPEGHAIGTLCVLDSVPRDLTGAQREALRSLARQVMRELALRPQRRVPLRPASDAPPVQPSAPHGQRTEERLAIYREIVRKSAEGITLIGLDGRCIEQNEANRNMLGYADEDLLGRTPVMILGEDAFTGIVEELGRTGTWQGELVCRRKDGRELDIELNVFVVRDASGTPFCYVGVKRDITERKRTEHALRESEERFRSAFEHAAIGKALVAPDGRFLQVNRCVCDIVGFSEAELRNRTFQSITHPDDLQADLALARRLLEGEIPSYQMEKRYIHKRGHIVWVLLSVSLVRDRRGDPLHFIAQIQDITERKRVEAALEQARDEMEQRVRERTAELQRANDDLKTEIAERRRIEEALLRSEQQLAQSQKMEAIGKLAGGVAHEFNNLLTVILGYGQAILDRLSSSDPLREDLLPMLESAQRAAGLTRQLLAFSRHQILAPRMVDINALVVRQDQMLRRLIGEHIEVELKLAPGLGRVKADAGQIEQVMLNLVNNARDAMPRGGRLVIWTENVDVVAGDRGTPRDLPPGRYVCVRVSDTGCGMSPDIQARIFEPFFTTKEVGSGTGLGLSTVYGIVTQSGGQVRVESRMGKGSTFRVYLPRIEKARPERAPGRVDAGSVPRGSETVLLVEDDSQVRALVRSVLSGSGYQVLLAPNGQQALEAASRWREPIHLLVTDVVMPGITGPELASQLHTAHPEARVLYMSGYLADSSALGLENGAVLIEKPFAPGLLARRVREILDGSSVAEAR